MLCEDVVFGDEVACTWMEGAGEEGTHDEVAESFATEVLDYQEVEGDLCNDVESMDPGQW